MASGRGREREAETRNQMMQNLFGEQSEDEREEEMEEEEVEEEDYEGEQEVEQQVRNRHVVDGEDDDNDVEGYDRRPDYHSEGEASVDFEGEGEGQGEVEAESEAEVEAHDTYVDQEGIEGERVYSSPERSIGIHRPRSNRKEVDSEDEGYGQHVVSSKVFAPVESDESDGNYVDHEDIETADTRKSRLPKEEKDGNEVVRDVFGDSEEDEPAEYEVQPEAEQEYHGSPMEDDVSFEKQPDDMVPDEDGQFVSEDENRVQKPERPIGPPLDLVIPSRRPPGPSDRMHIVKVSNIMGFEPKPFDPETYIEEDDYITDESGSRRIRLGDNIVRWRRVFNPDGTTSVESNARIVKWEDGTMQLFIGNEVLDIDTHDCSQDHSHLFLRHGQGIMQSQGRLLKKMRFMPSSLASKSHRTLTALVDSRDKKTYKVKNCFTEIDPEREKEEREKVEGQAIRAHQLLQRKKERVNRRYTPAVVKKRRLSPGLLEEPDEDEEPEDYYGSRRGAGRNRSRDDFDDESDRRTHFTKKLFPNKNIAPKSSVLPSHQRRQLNQLSESEREESEYETEGEDIENSPAHRKEELEHEDDYEDDEGEPAMSEEEPGRRKMKAKETGWTGSRHQGFPSDDDSPPRKPPVHRRKVFVSDSDDE